MIVNEKLYSNIEKASNLKNEFHTVSMLKGKKLVAVVAAVSLTCFSVELRVGTI
jgi:hypothetical protein